MRLTYKFKLFTLALVCALLITSCDKYLDVTPKGYTLLNSVTDYDQWLNASDLYLFLESSYLIYPSDLVDIANPPIPANTSTSLSYTWAPQLQAGTTFPAAYMWGWQYKTISAFNSVIIGVDDATDGTIRQKASLKAEARLGRAYEYFCLVNQYSKPYDSTTASKDPGVPIVVTDDVAQSTPPRGTVQEVYDFIISETTTAIADLPESNIDNAYRGSKGAAYSLLARTYFFARNYQKAKEYAELALKASPDRKLIDYNNVVNAIAIPGLSIRPDAIYARQSFANYFPRLDFMKSLDINDRRLRLFFYNLGDLSFTIRGMVQYNFGGGVGSKDNNLGTSVQEMMLIIAEVAARENDLVLALDILDELLKKRIISANYTRFESTDREVVLNKILQERKFEFPFNGLRWFDMRRLDKEGKMPPVKREDAAGNVFATLEPGSPQYTLQIPQLVLSFNPGMEQNPQ